MILILKKIIVRVLCLFIPDKSAKYKFRIIALHSLSAREINNLLLKISHSKIINDCGEDNTKRILHYSTYKIQCGIANFLDDYINGLKENNFNAHDVFPVNYDYSNDLATYLAYLDKFIEYANDYKIISIQHEYGFWSCKNIYKNEYLIKKYNLYTDKFKYNDSTFPLLALDYVMERLLKNSKKTVIVWHTDINRIIEEFYDCNNSAMSDYTRIPFFRFINNKNLNIIVMNKQMRTSLEKKGIPVNNVSYLPHPIPTTIIDTGKNQNIKLKEKYNISENDIIMGSFGFINEHKGILNVVKTMKYLPGNYKYLIAGGVHPLEPPDYFKILMKYIREQHLEKRVIITGFIDMSEVKAHMELFDIALALYSGSNQTCASGSINQLILNKIPVITTPAASFTDLKSDYNCLEVCEIPLDYEKLALQIQNLINDEERIHDLQNNCVKFCEQNTFKNFTGNIPGL